MIRFKRLLTKASQLFTAGVIIALTTLMTATSSPQAQTQPKPSPTPRRQLPKPVAGSRGFEQFAKRDASARLIAAAGTRVIVDPGDFYSKGEANYKAVNMKQR